MSFLPNQKTIIDNLGFSDLNEMQKEMIKASKKAKHIKLVAPTGSGKTVAFLLSGLHRIEDTQCVQLLILAPTRELVLQIENVIKQMKLGLKVNVCYGGHPFKIERRNLSHAPEILIGTPGRIMDHIERQTFDASTISQIIFDEFDKSLEFGFTNEMRYIYSRCTNIEYKYLVSATKSIDVPRFLAFNDPLEIEYKAEKKKDLKLKQIIVPRDEKPEGLMHLIYTFDKDQNAIVFSNHRDACNRIADHFNENGIPFSLFHGGLDQDERELELAKFRNGSAQVLIATDIAARGIDIPDLDFVIHYQIPLKEDVFLHRNGRTARMKASGTSVLVLTDHDYLPKYLDSEPELMVLKKDNKIHLPSFATLHLNKGKKDKVNKFDIVGYFLSLNCMEKIDLGLIEVKDYESFVGVNRDKLEQILNEVQNKKIKKKKVRITTIN
ncbi:MAG: DEAD/DEAH box helicase [Flavobacteriales bacterium]|nr:DEAD/DEAH box helicase [Flavobacteriales bacterium]